MANKKPKKKGRPLTELSDLPRDWKNIILSNMNEGASKVEVTAKLGIGSQLFYDLIKREPEFSKTIKRGVELCEAWWLTEGRTNLKNKSFSPILWYMNMKNRFGWKDKQELTGKDGTALTIQIVHFNEDEDNPST